MLAFHLLVGGGIGLYCGHRRLGYGWLVAATVVYLCAFFCTQAVLS
jgi:hypothetical protein